MIQVRVHKQDGVISKVSLKGHAGTAEYGKDLVCAAVSAIMFGFCNALDQIAGNGEAVIRSNLISAENISFEEKENVIFETLLVQLETVAEQYPDAVKIEIMEE